MISIIIPTFNEKANIPVITERIRGALHGESYEVIFVDDSTDDTPDELMNTAKKYSEFRYIHREKERGLATAVICGFELARGEILAVMDGDLQHPPELLPEMLVQIQRGADLVLPSRFLDGGGDSGLGFYRKMTAKVARVIGQLMLKQVRKVSDPMSGFFMLQRHVIREIKWNPIGWKILLEILVKGNYSTVVEIPYQFQERYKNQSKMSFQQQINYLRHVFRLVAGSPENRRLFLFLLVGLSGVLVNLIAFEMIHWLTQVSVIWVGVFSALVAMTSNFYLNEKFTWPENKPSAAIIRYFRYLLISVVGIGINLLTLFILYSKFGFSPFLANTAGIVTAIGWNFGMNSFWTWRGSMKHIRI